MPPVGQIFSHVTGHQGCGRLCLPNCRVMHHRHGWIGRNGTVLQQTPTPTSSSQHHCPNRTSKRRRAEHCPTWHFWPTKQCYQKDTSVEVRNAYSPYGAYAVYSGSQRIAHSKCQSHLFCMKPRTAIAQGSLNRHVNFREEWTCLSKVMSNPWLTNAKPPGGTATGTYSAYALIGPCWPNKGQ